MITEVILTVSESKRLIAKGVAKLPSVQKAMEVGGQSPPDNWLSENSSQTFNIGWRVI